ncbi:MAG: single-stranded DNA-binding protein [Propionibacteriales bacterium]|nr:single-stranded DNA-binding protein [Propionibacteriales bacterium]
MTDTVIHIIGHVGTDVDYRRVGSGTDLSTFRVASTPRRWDRGQRGYVDGTTTWLSVQCWRSLALHVRDSVRRGDPIVVVGKLKTEEWTKDGVRNSRFILDAISVGHDLNRGVSSFRKMAKPVETPADDSRDARDALQEIEDAEAVPYDERDDVAPALREAS